MIIIVGLGNPGTKFNHTRHNTGFMAIDFFAKKNDFPDFTSSKKYHSLVSEGTIEKTSPNSDGHQNHGTKVFLVKPETFMNESGKALASILKNKNDATLIVIHDDIDMPLGKIKFSKDSGTGGHKGVNSIIQHLGNNNFIQLKIGIATNDEKAEDVVLKKFTKEEEEILGQIIEKSAKSLDYLINNGLEKTMNEYNR